MNIKNRASASLRQPGWRSLVAWTACAVLLTACGGGGDSTTADASGPPPLVNEGSSAHKVLLVQVDGLTYDALADRVSQQAPVLSPLHYAPALTGGYTGTETEQRTTAAPGSGSVVTGVWANQHGIVKDEPDQALAPAAADLFGMLHAQLPGVQTALIAATSLYPSLLKASVNTGAISVVADCSGSDACVTKQGGEQLTRGADLVMLQYHAPAEAARQYGLGSEQYRSAVAQVSGQMSELLAIIDQRTAVDAKEDWLVMLTSAYGLDEYGTASGSQFPRNKTVFIASNKALPALVLAQQRATKASGAAKTSGAASSSGSAATAGSAGRASLAAGARSTADMSDWLAIVDIAPTVLRQLDLPLSSEDYRFSGNALQVKGSIRALDYVADEEAASIALNWRLSGADQQAVKLYRDGVLLATLPAGTTDYLDDQLPARDAQGRYRHRYTVAVGDAMTSARAEIGYTPPPQLAPTLVNDLAVYYPLASLPAVDARSGSTLGAWAVDADGGSIIPADMFGTDAGGHALHVDSSVRNAAGLAGYRLVLNRDVTNDSAVQGFTIGFWLRPEASCTQYGYGASVLANKNYDSGNTPGLAIGLFNRNGCDLRFNTGDGSSRDEAQGYQVTADQWAYVAISIDKAAKRMNAYVFDTKNGQQNGTLPLRDSILAALGGSRTNTLGVGDDSTGRYNARWNPSFNVAMAYGDFAVWERVLTLDELSSIYASRQPLSTLLP